MRKEIVSVMTLLLACIMSLVLITCSGDEPVFERVDDTFGDEIYFVSGRVTSNQQLLEGVTISVDGLTESVTTTSTGVYQLYLKEKRSYMLRFKKSGYVDLATQIVIDDSMANRSSLTVSVSMTKKSGTVVVEPDEEIEISDPTGRAVLSIPRSLTEQTSVGLTVYRDLPVTYSSSLRSSERVCGYLNVMIEPAGLVVSKPLTLRLQKQTSDAILFETMFLYQQTDEGEWVRQEGVVFDKERNAYITQINQFSSYSFRVPYSSEASPERVTDHLNGERHVNNCGNISAVRDVSLTVDRRCGWEFITDVGQAVASSFPALSSSDRAALSSIITEQVVTLEGTVPGFYDLRESLATVDVGGNFIMDYTNKAKDCEQTYTFSLNNRSEVRNVSVRIRKYTGMEERYSNISCYQHSGGGGK